MPHAGAVISQTTVMLHANYPVPLQLKIREKDKKNREKLHPYAFVCWEASNGVLFVSYKRTWVRSIKANLLDPTECIAQDYIPHTIKFLHTSTSTQVQVHMHKEKNVYLQQLQVNTSLKGRRLALSKWILCVCHLISVKISCRIPFFFPKIFMQSTFEPPI